MKNKNAVEDQFDHIVAKNAKEQYVFDLDLLRGKDRQIIRTLKKHGIKDKNCLDIGPGTGRFVQFLKSESARLICAADISSEALKCCENYVDDMQKLNLESDELKFKDDMFDIIISFEVLEHLKEPENYMKEIIRVAKKDAIVIMSLPNIISLISRARMIFGILPVAIASDKTHVSFYREKDIVRMLEKYTLTPFFLPTTVSLNPLNPKSRISLPANKYMIGLSDSLLFYFYINK
tara:strand:+ start:4483 stop:5187 length:705 start_codon:yes stop_codon:yes gene_type:complete